MSLRSSIRNTVRPGYNYCYVEQVLNRYATVRMGNRNGARLTNLPILGVLNVGDRAIVDYSAEGQPYVRAVTYYQEQDDGIQLPIGTISDIPDPDDDDPDDDPSFVYARAYRRSNWNSYAAWQSVSSPYRPYFAWTDFQYNTAPDDIFFLTNGTWIQVNIAGIYYIHYVIAVNPPAYPYTSYLNAELYCWRADGAADGMWWGTKNTAGMGGGTGITLNGSSDWDEAANGYSNYLMLRASTIWYLNAGDQFAILLEPRVGMYNYSNPPNYPMIYPATARYPYMDIWRVSGVETSGSQDKTPAYWFLYDWTDY